MTNPLYSVVAFAAGGMLAMQAGFNARLGVLARNTLLASTSAMLTAFLCVGALYLAFRREAGAEDVNPLETLSSRNY